jgi:hypothetical protein
VGLAAEGTALGEAIVVAEGAAVFVLLGAVVALGRGVAVNVGAGVAEGVGLGDAVAGGGAGGAPGVALGARAGVLPAQPARAQANNAATRAHFEPIEITPLPALNRVPEPALPHTGSWRRHAR